MSDKLLPGYHFDVVERRNFMGHEWQARHPRHGLSFCSAGCGVRRFSVDHPATATGADGTRCDLSVRGSQAARYRANVLRR